MKHSDDVLQKKIADIKWGKKQQNFICKKCGNEKCNIKKYPISLKCTKCDKLESAITNTAFQGSRMALSKKIEILLEIQKYFPIRLSQKQLAVKFDIEEKSIVEYYQTLYDWVISFTEGELDYNKEQWRNPELFKEEYSREVKFFEGLSKQSANIHNCLRFILFDWAGGKRSLKYILQILVLKKEESKHYDIDIT